MDESFVTAIKDYIRPELLVLVAVMWAIGYAIKKSKVNDALIPYILGGISIILCGLYIIGTCDFTTYKDIILGIFTSIVQGILVASLSVYGNQCVKQIKKANE